MAVILGAVTCQKPGELPGPSYRPWLIQASTGSAVLVLAVHLVFYSGLGSSKATEEMPRLQALAEHLTQAGAKFYGAYWCPHCEDQKAMFGASAHRLPYIECSPGGRRTPQASVCNAAKVRSYPTWFINGRRHEGAYSLRRLAQLSGFKGEL
jgi:glutaredoxin